MKRGRWVILVIIVGAMALSWWMDNLVAPQLTSRPAVAPHEPDYFFDDFAITTMGPQGRPHYRLEGRRLVHYADDDTAEIAAPRLEVTRPGSPRWTVNAEQGWLSPGGENIHLLGNVVMVRAALADRPGLRIQTRDLRIRKQDNQAQTDEAVKVTSVEGTVDSVGMVALFDSGRLDLLSEVRGLYLTPGR